MITITTYYFKKENCFNQITNTQTIYHRTGTFNKQHYTNEILSKLISAHTSNVNHGPTKKTPESDVINLKGTLPGEKVKTKALFDENLQLQFNASGVKHAGPASRNLLGKKCNSIIVGYAFANKWDDPVLPISSNPNN